MKSIAQVLTETPNATDAEIVAAIDASRGWRRVPIAEVKAALFAFRLNGVLELAANDTQLPVPLRAAVAEFQRGVLLYESLDATQEPIRNDVLATLAGLAQTPYVTAEQAAAFGDLLREKLPANLTGQIAEHRRRVSIQSGIAAANAATRAANEQIEAAKTFIKSALEWTRTGTGTMPTWGE